MKAAMLALIAVALTGCSASKPAHNVGFGAARSLRELDGTYRNLGETDPRHTRNEYLSGIIWPGLGEAEHPAIRTIVVTALGDTALSVVARDSSGVAREQTFIRGKDFEFNDGRLRLKTVWKNSLKEPEAGGLFFVRTTQELGVDKKGQGKFKKRDVVAGAAYLVVPIAYTESDEVRFIRIEEGP